MTCKECLCYEVCKNKWAYEMDLLPFGSRNYMEGMEEKCEFFKPKSRFVELPCEETIMYVKDNWLMLNMESEHLGEAIKRSVDYLTKNARDRE